MLRTGIDRTIGFVVILTLLAGMTPSAVAWQDAQDSAEKSGPSIEQRLARLADQLEEQRQLLHIPGMSIAVVRDDEVVMARGFGLRDVERDLPATEETIYAIGSTTKAFTSAMIAALVDEGLMEWDAPVRTYVPEFSVKDETANEQAVVRDLLCHRIGLMRMDMCWYSGDASMEDIMRCVRRAEPRAKFREAFHYSNPMFLIAGTAAGRAAGTDWNTLLKERILTPLGMKRSNTSVESIQGDEHLALGYLWETDAERWKHLPMRRLDNIAPAGAINSNVTDMAQWLRLQLNRGEVDGRRLISAEQFDVMWEPQIEMTPGVSYCLGWMTREWSGRRVLEHGGGIDGFTAHVALLPDEGIGLVVLSNANGASIGSLATALVFDALLGEWKEDAAPADLAGVEKYLGSYHFDVMDSDFTVLVQNGRLAIDVPGQIVYETNPPNEEGRRSFRGFEQIEVSFNEDDSGQVISMMLYQGGAEFEIFRNGVEIQPEIDPAEAQQYLGQYRFEPANHNWEVKIQHGRLAVDVPGEIAYELYPPAEDGRWVFRPLKQFSVAFVRDESGAVTGMNFNRAGQEFDLPRVDVQQAAPLPTVEEVERLVHEGMGSEAYENLLNLRMTGTVDFVHQGVTGSVTILAAGYDRFAEEVDLGIYGWMRTARLGDDGWSDDAFTSFEKLDGEKLEYLQLQHPALLLSSWSIPFDEVRVLSREMVGEKEAIVVQAKPPVTPAFKIYIDPDTGLLLKSTGFLQVEGAGRLAITATYEDYRDVAGVKIPFRSKIENPAYGLLINQINEIETNVRLDGDPFMMEQPPAEVTGGS